MSAPRRYAYLGPEGTFTEAALRMLTGTASGVLSPYPTVTAALDSVRSGNADAAMVAVESSVEGAVPITLDELATGEPLMIIDEVLLPISFALLVRPGARREDLKTVSGHPHAQPQCRRWLAGHLAHAEWRPALSNSEAARQVADGVVDAALAGAFTAERYGLAVLVDDIHDVADAVTRFVLVTRPDAPPAPTGADRTSLMAYIGDDHPGALLEILTEFAMRGINLTWIQSRPTGDGIGSYHFSIDCEGHITDARVGEALMALRRVCADVRFLGSYPRADLLRPDVRRGTSDADYTEAEAWLAAIRAGRALSRSGLTETGCPPHRR